MVLNPRITRRKIVVPADKVRRMACPGKWDVWGLREREGDMKSY